jgi:hypothetical protein
MIKKFPEFNVRFLELVRKVLEKVAILFILASKGPLAVFELTFGC